MSWVSTEAASILDSHGTTSEQASRANHSGRDVPSSFVVDMELSRLGKIQYRM